jgi:hypothetical protein
LRCFKKYSLFFIFTEGERQIKQFTRAKTFDDSQASQDIPEDHATPLLRHSPHDTDNDMGDISKVDISPPSIPTAHFRLCSDQSSQDRTSPESPKTPESIDSKNNYSGESDSKGKLGNDDSSPALPTVIIKSPSGSSIKNRGHLVRQKTTDREDCLQEEDDESSM